MSYEGYQDRILTCRDCGQEFTFTSGEQEFFASKGLTNAPSRCPECRKARRGNSFSSARPRSEQHEAICASCGKTTTVPFIPREDRPVYCSDCFQEQRSSRASRGSYSGSSYGGGWSGRSGGGGGGGGGRDRRDRGSDWGDRW
ncbi:MAG TPA: zinc-ribbon domain containing protein [Ktedonobacteraceae bacterium]|jgi:CxxC-x17-CxxC domain-containing protein